LEAQAGNLPVLNTCSSKPAYAALTCAALHNLQSRSQEARTNWEAALDSKDRAIAQLEDALVARQRTVDQLAAANSSGPALVQDYSRQRQNSSDLEAALAEAQAQAALAGQELQRQRQQASALEQALANAQAQSGDLADANTELRRQVEQLRVQLAAGGRGRAAGWPDMQGELLLHNTAVEQPACCPASATSGQHA
jgi:predicted  nucleic acid-binding Zn-ribbon protein